ncbi:Hypothetical protein NTJ_15604 [Nesidiocoris tenuis]|uniref:Uncharacterized protein n=1 Tax=Nesidiocoris tenuis TaxID=355587 RepID=A0ABN7BEJ2_9HEMI|nr:Hypothetical protein NTJ_15604 [Nesidiocoris tenuis]
MARDYLTFRSMNAKRKSAVEILQETKSLFVKSEAVLDAEQRLVKAPKCDPDAPAAKPVEARREPTSAKVRKKVTPTHTRSRSDQLQTKLRRLLNSNSKENVADGQSDVDDVADDDDWTSFDMRCNQQQQASLSIFENHLTSDIQYKSLPDLSTGSSRDSHSVTIQPAMSESKKSDLVLADDKDMVISAESDTSVDESIDSSEKSYGKPPTLPKSLESMGGSFGKVEERLTTWTEAKHKPLSRCKSDVTVNEDRRMSVSRLPHQPSLPSELNEFFQNLGLTSDQYK